MKSIQGRVLAFGTFDLLHPGHLAYLTQARKLGRELVVIVAKDQNVLAFKGHLPVQSEQDRLQIVSSLKMVHSAFLGEKTDFFKKIKALQPEIVCQGYDQWPGKKKLEPLLQLHGINARVVQAKPYKTHKHKSTKIKQAIRNQKRI